MAGAVGPRCSGIRGGDELVLVDRGFNFRFSKGLKCKMSRRTVTTDPNIIV